MNTAAVIVSKFQIGEVPKGTLGTIVHTYDGLSSVSVKNNTYYVEVEFILNNLSIVKTVSTNQIETTRQTALKWWNNINGTFEQKKLGDDYCKSRACLVSEIPLTGREIEEIWLKSKTNEVTNVLYKDIQKDGVLINWKRVIKYNFHKFINFIKK